MNGPAELSIKPHSNDNQNDQVGAERPSQAEGAEARLNSGGNNVRNVSIEENK